MFKNSLKVAVYSQLPFVIHSSSKKSGKEVDGGLAGTTTIESTKIESTKVKPAKTESIKVQPAKTEDLPLPVTEVVPEPVIVTDEDNCAKTKQESTESSPDCYDNVETGYEAKSKAGFKIPFSSFAGYPTKYVSEKDLTLCGQNLKLETTVGSKKDWYTNVYLHANKKNTDGTYSEESITDPKTNYRSWTKRGWKNTLVYRPVNLDARFKTFIVEASKSDTGAKITYCVFDTQQTVKAELVVMNQAE